MALEKVYDYFHNYDRQTYQVVACMGNEPSEHDIKKFEHQYGINLPADFREFTMSPLGGLYMEVREEIWPRAKQYDIGPFWSFCRGIIVYGIANGIPDFLDIREKTKELHDEGLIVVRNYKSCGWGRERCDRKGHAVFLRPRVDSAIMGSASTGISTSSTKLKKISTFCRRLPPDLSGA